MLTCDEWKESDGDEKLESILAIQSKEESPPIDPTEDPQSDPYANHLNFHLPMKPLSSSPMIFSTFHSTLFPRYPIFPFFHSLSNFLSKFFVSDCDFSEAQSKGDWPKQSQSKNLANKEKRDKRSGALPEGGDKQRKGVSDKGKDRPHTAIRSESEVTKSANQPTQLDCDTDASRVVCVANQSNLSLMQGSSLSVASLQKRFETVGGTRGWKQVPNGVYFSNKACTPPHLSLMVAAQRRGEDCRMADMCCGLGSLTFGLLASLLNEPEGKTITAFEVDPVSVISLTQRLAQNGCNKVSVERINVFSEQFLKRVVNGYEPFDYIVSNPPWKLIFPLLVLCEVLLKEKGRLALVAPSDFLESTKTAREAFAKLPFVVDYEVCLGKVSYIPGSSRTRPGCDSIFLLHRVKGKPPENKKWAWPRFLAPPTFFKAATLCRLNH